MDVDRESRIQEIAEPASRLEGDERSGFLDGACGDDGELRTAVEQRLEEARVRLDHSDVERTAPTLVLGPDDRPHPGGELVRRLARRSSTADPESGRYRVTGEIARGGQGAIYRAWDEDLRRYLAMKVVHHGDGQGRGETPPPIHPRHLSRFLDEALVTGQLDHPGIVPVHEMGLDSQGRMFFTMKLVRGRSLSEIFKLCERGEEGWTTTRVLGVLQKVCDAMAYAHSKGVVHRDLKPANVMVGRFGEVYVMDWGLAKVVGQPDHRDVRIDPDLAATAELRSQRQEEAAADPGAPLMTMDGDVVGTPSYMSPEQARGEDLGPQADVYSLGTMLYHLLTGRIPYVTPGARTNSYALWQLVQQGPPVALEALAPNTPPELAAICQRAMERRPEDRYRDMAELSEDLRAYVEGRVVRALPEGLVSRGRKWIHRNRMAAGAFAGLALVSVAALAGLANASPVGLAVVVVVVLGALVGVTWMNLSAKRRLVSFLSNLFDENLATLDSTSPTRVANQLLERAGQRIKDDLGREPEVQARLLDTMGCVHHALGQYAEARGLLERALDLRRGLGGNEDLDTARTTWHLGRLALAQSRLGEAEDLHREALAVFRKQLGPEHSESLDALLGLAETHVVQDKFALAEELTREVVDLRRLDLGEEHPDTLRSVLQLGTICSHADRLVEAERLLLDVVDKARRSEGEADAVRLEASVQIVRLRRLQHRFRAAEAIIREVIDDSRRTAGEDHPQTIDQRRRLAVLLLHQDQAEEAQRLLSALVADARRVLGQEHSITLSCQFALAQAYDRMGRGEQTLQLAESLLHGNLRVFGPRHRNTLVSRGYLARVQAERGDVEQAVALVEETVEGLESLVGNQHQLYLATRIGQADILSRAGDGERAAAVAEVTLAALRAAHGPDDRRSLEALACMTRVRWRQGWMDEALELATELVDRTPIDDVHIDARRELRADIQAAMREGDAA